MFPVYKYMDPFPQPHQRNHTPYPQHYCPGGWEAVSPQMKMDPVEPHVTYEPWSYGGSYGCTSPVQCHGCCNHSFPPGYFSFGPHHPPTPSLYYHRPYPSYHEAYPAYDVPPVHYSMEQPKYEYDKNTHGNHCCGCLNNAWNRKEDKGVKIEEPEPEIEKKESNSPGPVKSNNHTHPIVWIPPECLKNKASSKPSELEPKVLNGWFPLDVKNDESNSKAAKLDPNTWNSWLPLDMNSIKSLMQGGNKKRNNNQDSEDDNAEFPFPMIWIPSKEKKPGEVKNNDLWETNTSPKVAEEPQVNFKFIPVKLFGNGDHVDRPGAVEDTSGSMACSKTEEQVVKPKDIPVKQNEETLAKKSSEDDERKPKTIAVTQPKEENEEKLSSSDKNAEKRTPSSIKTSKLPPVCLRVDPLPRRKSGNGASRSPSPPGLKSKMQQNSDGTSKASSVPITKNEVQQDSKVQEAVQNKAEEVQPRKEIKVVEVNEATRDEVTGISTTEKAEMCETKFNAKEDEGATVEKHEEERKEKKDLSTAEAAILIQSAYRGFEVRKWEPLKKLKQIARVNEQVDEVQEHIHKLECSPELQKDEKQKILIGETIMGLLLQLDTIQGLHPSVRDIRKSVARELIFLQEKLDCLTIQKAEEPKSMELDKTGVEDHYETANNHVDTPIELAEGPKTENLAKNPYESSSYDSNQLAEVRNESKESRGLLYETSNSNIDEQLLADEVSVDSVKESTESSIVRGEEADKDGLQAMPSVNFKDKMADEDLDTSCEVMGDAQNVNDELKFRPEETSELPFVGDYKAESKVKEPTGSHPEVRVHELELETKSKVNEPQISEFPFVEAEKTDSKVEELTDQLIKDTVHESELEVKSTVAEPHPNRASAVNLQEELPMPPTSSVEENVKLNIGKGEDSVSQGSDADSKPEDLLVLPTGVEKSEKIEVSKPEQLLSMHPLLENKSLVEEPIAVDDTSNVHSCDVDTISFGSSGITLEAKEDMEMTFENDKDDDSTRPIVVAGEIENGSCPLEVQGDISVQLPHTQQEEAKESEAMAVKDATLVHLSVPRIVEEVVMDSVPVNEVLSEEMGDSHSVANASRFPLEQPELGRKGDNNLDEENEKLREMLEKLIQAGKQQLTVISELNGRVKDLERKLSRKKKMKMRRHRAAAASAAGSPCFNLVNNA